MRKSLIKQALLSNFCPSLESKSRWWFFALNRICIFCSKQNPYDEFNNQEIVEKIFSKIFFCFWNVRTFWTKKFGIYILRTNFESYRWLDCSENSRKIYFPRGFYLHTSGEQTLNQGNILRVINPEMFISPTEIFIYINIQGPSLSFSKDNLFTLGR